MTLRHNLRPLIGAALICLSLCGTQAAAAQKSPQAAAVVRAANSFYRFYLSRETGFTASNVRRLRRWLTPELHDLLQYELRREAQYAKAHPDEVPYMNGDPFTDSQEVPDSFRVGSPAISGDRARVEVTFLWHEQNDTRRPRGRVVQRRKLRLEMSRRGGRWLVGDIVGEEGNGLLSVLRRKEYMP